MPSELTKTINRASSNTLLISLAMIVIAFIMAGIALAFNRQQAIIEQNTINAQQLAMNAEGIAEVHALVQEFRQYEELEDTRLSELLELLLRTLDRDHPHDLQGDLEAATQEAGS
jgi:flagellar biosynthesis protein FliP